MLAFVCLEKPRSHQAESRSRYQDHLRSWYINALDGQGYDGQDLYGLVYYLKNSAHDLDADNLSKPVWDALSGLAYVDDRVIQYRQAGIIDMGQFDIGMFDLSSVSDEVAERLIEVVGTEEHVLYVEFGPLNMEMFDFGLT